MSLKRIFNQAARAVCSTARAMFYGPIPTTLTVLGLSAIGWDFYLTAGVLCEHLLSDTLPVLVCTTVITTVMATGCFAPAYVIGKLETAIGKLDNS